MQPFRRETTVFSATRGVVLSLAILLLVRRAVSGQLPAPQPLVGAAPPPSPKVAASASFRQFSPFAAPPLSPFAPPPPGKDEGR